MIAAEEPVDASSGDADAAVALRPFWGGGVECRYDGEGFLVEFASRVGVCPCPDEGYCVAGAAAAVYPVVDVLLCLLLIVVVVGVKVGEGVGKRFGAFEAVHVAEWGCRDEECDSGGRRGQLR